jgi:hypothetical protein
MNGYGRGDGWRGKPAATALCLNGKSCENTDNAKAKSKGKTKSQNQKPKQKRQLRGRTPKRFAP